MTGIAKLLLGSVFDGAGRWVLAGLGAAALLSAYALREAKVERLVRADERASVVNDIEGVTHATKEKLRGAAARSADRGVRGVLDPSTRYD